MQGQVQVDMVTFSQFFSSKIQKIRDELDNIAATVSPASTDVLCPSLF